MRDSFVLACTAALLLISAIATATHLRAVEITARPLSCSEYKYEITVTAYLNSASGISFGGDQSFINFGDGARESIPETPGVVIDAFNNVSMATFKVIHTYPGPGQYLITISQPNRNEGIANVSASVNTPLYTETLLTIEAGQCNTTPQYGVPPINRACTGVTFHHHPGAFDINGDSLSFALTTPKRERDVDVSGYLPVNDRRFYDNAGINYNKANESKNGPPTANIDPVTGLFTWDAPGAPGEYVIAIKIIEWKYNLTDSMWFQSGYSVLDMQIIVESCANRKPILSFQQDICVVAGELVDFTMRGSDADGHPVLIESFSILYNIGASSATRIPSADVLQSTQPPNDTASMKFQWQTTCDHIRDQSYAVIFKITDHPPSGPLLVEFKTVNIKVIAPAPEYEKVTVNPVSRNVLIEWKDHACNDVKSYQVWRRVTKFDYDQPECENGMPRLLRYKLIAEISPDQQSYNDNQINIGALYCYRIVALIGAHETPSRISLDTCIIPRPAEAPVITNVSVQSTSVTAGQISIRWTSPFEIDKQQYPPPYRYKVLRSQNGEDFIPVSELLSDTVFTDTPANTVEQSYFYKVQLFVPSLTSNAVDTSSQASSVFAAAAVSPDRIVISWEAETPWYNYLQHHPYHLIYRSSKGSNDSFVLIDSVDVNVNGFVYEDKGTFQGQPLESGSVYFYKVLTRGGYGNPKITEPLQNFSQDVRAIFDTSRPCAPHLTIEEQDCSTLPCANARYANTLRWNFPATGASCNEPSLTYSVYVVGVSEDDIIFLGNTNENSFVHGNLSTQEHCYMVAATDAAGNRSELSNSACADNCAFFSLPNVFTPGHRDGYNDVFMAHTEDPDGKGCPKFVETVDLKILNRWGQEIHLVKGVTENDKFIFWNGQTVDGKTASEGIYFYHADVTFDVRDPSQQRRTYKGWIHLVRD